MLNVSVLELRFALFYNSLQKEWNTKKYNILWLYMHDNDYYDNWRDDTADLLH